MTGVRAARGNSGRGYGLLAPTLLVMALALAAPLALLTLHSQSGITLGGWTLAQYGEVLGRASYRGLFARSVMISGLVTLATVVLAYPMAYFVAFHVRFVQAGVAGAVTASTFLGERSHHHVTIAGRSEPVAVSGAAPASGAVYLVFPSENLIGLPTS